MAGWLSRIFRDVELADLPLQFHLDTDARGRHVTRVSYTIGDETQWIEDVGALGAYGRFSIERDGRR